MKIILECPAGGALRKFLDSSNSQEYSPPPPSVSGTVRLKLARNWKWNKEEEERSGSTLLA